jgi:beta-1,4-mannosyl-glycoprotein beta-1,4-N-acetylglucosaminyltransferase
MLVDAFMFYNELDVLELRLTVLDGFVDRFVIVESEVNHAGGAKELFFQNNKERFSKWLPKIEHIIVTAEEAPTDDNPWSREKYQRECVLRGLTDVPNESIVMISDLDEIPDMTKIPFEKLPHMVCSVHMWMFEYSFDYIFTGEPWIGTVITNCELFKRAGPNHLRDNRWKFPHFRTAGWHLSSFGNGAHVATKHLTFAHWKDQRKFKVDPQAFDDLITRGIHTDGETPLVPRPEGVPLPAPVEVLRRLKLGNFS